MKYTEDVFDWDGTTPYGKVTKAKKRVKKALGIAAALKPFRWWTNAKRRIKRKVGYES
ncbi:MAG TPA: hypothetical protein PLF81_28350 [Candidatus Anammoximicrobium sp.]|nr:hypothetical protein [Candidatus Anammoximicrobium sp.]